MRTAINTMVDFALFLFCFCRVPERVDPRGKRNGRRPSGRGGVPPRGGRYPVLRCGGGVPGVSKATFSLEVFFCAAALLPAVKRNYFFARVYFVLMPFCLALLALAWPFAWPRLALPSAFCCSVGWLVVKHGRQQVGRRALSIDGDVDRSRKGF